jgi:hypothetical protein
MTQAVYGYDVAAGGDINGDGYGDYLVGEPFASDPETREGRFHAVYGGPCGPACGPALDEPVPNGWEGNQPSAEQGLSVALVNDLNGDGYADAVVGAPAWDSQDANEVGRIQVYLGGPAGLSATPSFTLVGSDASAQLGFSVAAAGDVNGDGLGDFLASAPFATAGGASGAGKVYLFLGAATPSGVVPTPAWIQAGTVANQSFGITVAGAGDVNRDGLSDVLVGTANTGSSAPLAAYVYLGQPGGLGTAPVATLTGFEQASFIGMRLSSAGDVNGDGYADVALGEPDWVGPLGNGQGRVRVFLGQPGGINTTAATTIDGLASSTRFGSAIGGGGDVNGDGYGDLVVGANGSNTGSATGEGLARVYLGGPGGLSATIAREFADTPGVRSAFGFSAALNVDVNGDGFADALIGAVIADGGGVTSGGGVFVHFGGGRAGAPRPVQMRRAGTTVPIALLGAIKPETEGTAFDVASHFSSPAGRAFVRVQLESKPLASPFDGGGLAGALTPVLTGLGGADFTTTGTCAFPAVCHWRLRLRSPNPFFPDSIWLSPAGDSPTEIDLRGGGDSDGDGVADGLDDCPTVANPGPIQADADGDGVGDACDNCVNAANARVPGGSAAFLAANPWATLTGGQRDDDHDGFGNVCDAKFTATGLSVGPTDTAQYKASLGHDRTTDTCGTSHTTPCAIFDLNLGQNTDGVNAINPVDTARYKLLLGSPPGPKCASCPLPCEAGPSGSCP